MSTNLLWQKPSNDFKVRAVLKETVKSRLHTIGKLISDKTDKCKEKNHCSVNKPRPYTKLKTRTELSSINLLIG